MPSFDIVSRINMQEIDNAVNQARKEIQQRFDFKGAGTEIEHEEGDIHVRSADEYKVKAALEIVNAKLARRGVPLKAFSVGPMEPGSGGGAKQRITAQQGVKPEHAREIIKIVKQSKLKVQAAIQGDEVRISGKKRDDLQQVIAKLEGANFPAPLQFVNFRD